jgi:hypothetical protein
MIIPITAIILPILNISLTWTFPEELAIAAVGSEIGSINDKEQAIATGTAYNTAATPVASAKETEIGINIADNAILDII